MTSEMKRHLRDKELARVRGRMEEDPQSHHPCRVARLRAGYSIAEMAQKADVSPGTLGSVERYESPGTRSTRRRVSRALSAPVSSLFGDPR